MPTEDIALRLRVDQLKADFAKIPGLTDAAIGKAASVAGKHWQKAEDAASKAAKGTSKEWESKLRSVEKVADKVTGGMAGDFKDAAEALSALGPAGAAVAGGFAVAAGAVLGAGAALVALQDRAEAAIKRLDELGMQDMITAEQREAVIQANAAMDALWVVADRLVITLAADLGPAFASAATQAVDLALGGLEAVDAFTKVHSVAEEFAIFLVDTLIQAIAFPVTGLAQLAEILGNVGEAMGFTNNVVLQAADAYDELTRSAAMWVTGLDGMDDSLAESSGELTEGEKLVARLAQRYRDAANATKEHAKATKDSAAEVIEVVTVMAEAPAPVIVVHEQASAAVVETWQKAWQQTGKDTQAFFATYGSLIGESLSAVDALGERWTETHTQRLGEVRAERAALRAGYAEMTEQEKTVAAAKMAALEEQAQAHRRAVMAGYIAQKAAAVTQASINATLTVANVMANIPPPAWPVAIPLAVAAGATQVALVASEPAPKFHVGRSPDEVPALLTKPEGVASAQAMAQPGFPERLARANQGLAPDASGVTELHINGRLAGKIVHWGNRYPQGRPRVPLRHKGPQG